jgi:DNA-binding LytR/AlgR family response regulator
LKELFRRTDPEKFWQIHADAVNVGAIASVSRDGLEKQSVHLRGRPEKLAVSRQFFHLFRQM